MKHTVLPCSISRGDLVRLMRPDQSSIAGFHKRGGSHAEAVANAEFVHLAATNHPAFVDALRTIAAHGHLTGPVLADVAATALRQAGLSISEAA